MTTQSRCHRARWSQRFLTVAAALVTIFALTGCGALGLAGVGRTEQSSFDLRPGSMSPEQALDAVNGGIPGGTTVIPGSVRHVATVDGPGGTIDFIEYREKEPQWGEMTCQATIATDSSSSTCGPPDEMGLPEGEVIANLGTASGDGWLSATVAVSDEVANLRATATDGTEYTMTPAEGFAYVEWPEERGSLVIVAYDADGTELGSITASMG